MSTFQDNMDSDRDVILNTDEFAQEITYTPSGGDDKTINAVVMFDQREAEYSERGRTYTRFGQIIISDDATDGVADPGYDDTVTINSEAWAVFRIRKEGNMHTIDITRIEEVEKGFKGI
jgi:hypothetical protein